MYAVRLGAIHDLAGVPCFAHFLVCLIVVNDYSISNELPVCVRVR